MTKGKNFFDGFFCNISALLVSFYYFSKFLDLIVSAMEIFLENRGDITFWLRDIFGDKVSGCIFLV